MPDGQTNRSLFKAIQEGQPGPTERMIESGRKIE